MSGTTKALDDSTTLSDAQPPSPLPQRPIAVPPAAVWVEADGEWQLRHMDDSGRPHGPFRSWREDGSLRTICAFDHGQEVGAVWRLHPDGSLLSLGCYTKGIPRGVHRRYASIDPRGERLQSCCVPPGAWQLRQDYSCAESFERAWYSRTGERLLDSGALYPARPATVPQSAWYDESAGWWEAGAVSGEGGPTGTRRRWSTAGVLRLVENLAQGKRHGQVQSFDDGGALVCDAHYQDGLLSGPFRAPLLPPGHFTDPRARGQQGAFLRDQAIGPWKTFDEAGATIDERDLGLPFAEAAPSGSPAFANEGRTAAAWRQLAQAFFVRGQVGEGLIATARAAAQANAAPELVEVLRGKTLLLGRDAALDEARQAIKRAAEDPVALMDALKRGADPATIFWTLARALPGDDLVALDLVTAALLLSPDAAEARATRVLLHGGLGDLEAARADAAWLAGVAPEQSTFLELFLRVYSPRFTFWPEEHSFTGMAADVPLTVERELPEVRQVIQRYATRLRRLREGLRLRLAALGRQDLDALPFMIPDLTPLLPEGPLSLTRSTFEMSAAAYAGVDDQQGDSAESAPEGEAERDGELPSLIEIVIDETHEVAPVPSTVLGLLRRARADWSGLVWLCWAVGLDHVALPDLITPPAMFGSAAVMTMARTWRCRDKLLTSGLLALTKGVPGFEWEGTPIDAVPAALVDVALGEYLEARAVFSWLCDPDNRSPWQDDLRRIDG